MKAGRGRAVPRAVASLSLAILLFASGATAQQPSAATMERIAPSVGRVLAGNCGNTPMRTGTAFLWRDANTVVTARHVVAGCSSIHIRFGRDGGMIEARPERELRARDLVLLRLVEPAASTPLESVEGIPEIGSRVAVIGFALGAPTLDSKLLDVTVANAPPGSVLRDLLPDRLRETLEATARLILKPRSSVLMVTSCPAIPARL